ncbi:MAG: YHS domain-containing protein [Candidatus Aquicultorales bacterium]
MARCMTCAAVGVEEPVDEEMAKQNGWTVEYEGKTYYFDSEEHMREFQEDPAKHVQMAREKGMAA